MCSLEEWMSTLPKIGVTIGARLVCARNGRRWTRDVERRLWLGGEAREASGAERRPDLAASARHKPAK